MFDWPCGRRECAASSILTQNAARFKQKFACILTKKTLSLERYRQEGCPGKQARRPCCILTARPAGSWPPPGAFPPRTVQRSRCLQRATAGKRICASSARCFPPGTAPCLNIRCSPSPLTMYRCWWSSSLSSFALPRSQSNRAAMWTFPARVSWCRGARRSASQRAWRRSLPSTAACSPSACRARTRALCCRTASAATST